MPKLDRWTMRARVGRVGRVPRGAPEAMLVELPLPADAGLVAFDRAAALYEDIGAILSDTTREHQRQIILAIVESVRATEGGVSEVRVRPEARPFFRDYVAGDAPTDDASQRGLFGCWRPRTDSGILSQQRSTSACSPTPESDCEQRFRDELGSGAAQQ